MDFLIFLKSPQNANPSMGKILQEKMQEYFSKIKLGRSINPGTRMLWKNVMKRSTDESGSQGRAEPKRRRKGWTEMHRDKKEHGRRQGSAMERAGEGRQTSAILNEND